MYYQFNFSKYLSDLDKMLIIIMIFSVRGKVFTTNGRNVDIKAMITP